ALLLQTPHNSPRIQEYAAKPVPASPAPPLAATATNVEKLRPRALNPKEVVRPKDFVEPSPEAARHDLATMAQADKPLPAPARSEAAKKNADELSKQVAKLKDSESAALAVTGRQTSTGAPAAPQSNSLDQKGDRIITETVTVDGAAAAPEVANSGV